MTYKKYKSPIIISNSSFTRSSYVDDSVVFYTYPTIIYDIKELSTIILELERISINVIKLPIDVIILKIMENSLSKTIKISPMVLQYIHKIGDQIKHLTIFANFRKHMNVLPVFQFQIIYFEIFVLKNTVLFELIEPYFIHVEHIITNIAQYYKRECILSIQNRLSANYDIDAYTLKYDVNPDYKNTQYYKEMIAIVNNILYLSEIVEENTL